MTLAFLQASLRNDVHVARLLDLRVAALCARSACGQSFSQSCARLFAGRADRGKRRQQRDQRPILLSLPESSFAMFALCRQNSSAAIGIQTHARGALPNT